MPEENQERFEDYLELDTYLEALQAGHVVHLPKDMTPDLARIYLMALLLHSVSSEVCTPQPAFADILRLRLEQEIQQMAKRPRKPTTGNKPFQKKPHAVSRRSVLTGGATVAASLVIGAGIEYAIGQVRESIPPSPATTSTTVQNTPLVPAIVPSMWHFVTTLADLSDNAVRFTSDTVVGYVLRTGGTGGNSPTISKQTSDQIIAMSAACTHMGCIVQWHDVTRQFHCPCHGAIFTEKGIWVIVPGAWNSLLPLPRLATKVEDGNVYVQVPLRQQ